MNELMSRVMQLNGDISRKPIDVFPHRAIQSHGMDFSCLAVIVSVFCSINDAGKSVGENQDGRGRSQLF